MRSRQKVSSKVCCCTAGGASYFTLGLGLFILAAQIGAARGFTVVIVCHVSPGAAVRVAQCLHLIAQSHQRLELAAASLRKPGRVIGTVTLPLLLPGLFSGWLFAAILSFNEFTASLFVTAQRTQTLPVAMYN